MAKKKSKASAAIKISACYMVKNAASDLRRSIKSLAAYVDEIIVVDTGSTDSTVAVAESFGAKIFHEPWQDDFSAPRNVALRAAKGNWIVFLDADEFFVNDTAKNLRAVIKLAQKINSKCLAVKWVNVDADNDNAIINFNYVNRIFENAPDVRYVGKIHEEIYRGDKPLTGVPVPADLLTLWHTGYSKNISRAKSERNLKLLLEELATTDKPERIYAYLTDCYFGLGDFANAEKFARLDLHARINPSNRPIKILLEILEKDPSRLDECLGFAFLAAGRYPKFPEFSAKLAQCFAQRGDYQKAVEEMELAIVKYEHRGGELESSSFDDKALAYSEKLIADWEEIIYSQKKTLPPDEKRREVSKLMDELIRGRELLSNNKLENVRLAKKIFAIEPNDPEPVEQVASLFIDYQMADEAESAVAYLEKNFPPTAYRLFLRARVCRIKDNDLDSIKFAEQALELDGDFLTVMLIHNLLGQAYRRIGDPVKAVVHYEINSKLDLSAHKDSPHFAQAVKIRREEYSNYLFNLHNLNVSREKLFAETRGFNNLLTHIPRFKHNIKKHRHKKIRVGYISPDVRFHVVAFFSTHFFTSYDKTRFEVFIYANNGSDNITEQFRANVDAFRCVEDLPANEIAAQIFKDEIDILVDLAGHTANNSMEILSYKPAPLQISGIGYMNSTGLDTVDYFIADKFTDPAGLNEKFFTEKILRLQHSHFCYVWHDFSHYVTPAPCLEKNFVTFGSFNDFCKVNDGVLKVWAEILNAVPDSRLYLKAAALTENRGLEIAKQRLQAAGINLERVDLEPFSNVYVKNYQRVDIALDTFPYPGGGTTCDALYMGVPVITLVGERHNSRFGYSLLMNIGLEELCAENESDYVQKAVALANDKERLGEYHLTLRRKMELSPVMNDTIYMGELEAAYEKIFLAWLNNKPLPDFAQEPELITPELADKYFKRAKSYIPLENKIGESNYPSRFDFKRTLYYAELAAHCEPKRSAELLLTIADRRHMLDDNVGAYEMMRESVAKIDKNFPDNLAAEYHLKLASYAHDNGHHAVALEHYQRAFELTDNPVKKLEFYDAILLLLHFFDITSEELAAPHFEYQEFFEGIEQFTSWHKRGDRIKIGYISGDFRQHAAFAVVFGFISCHDRNNFEIFCYSRNKKDDAYTELYKKAVEHFIDVRGLSNREIAEKIHDDGIDIAFDLAGHTGYNGLPVLAYKPARIQICGIGYMSTTGLEAIDYFITDEILDPPGSHEKYFSEKFLYMPAQFSYARKEDAPVPSGAACVENKFVTFGTVCRYSKINDEMLAVWAEILNRVPDSKLVMRAQEYISNRTCDELYRRMKSLGFDMNRVIFRPAVHDYFRTISKIDIMLDAYPYVGGTTTLDALFMGVPVITLYGERHSTRFGLSILNSVGLAELAVDNVDDYIARAVALANDFETLNVLHKNLRQMFLNSEALDPIKYCRQLEKKFAELL